MLQTPKSINSAAFPCSHIHACTAAPWSCVRRRPRVSQLHDDKTSFGQAYLISWQQMHSNTCTKAMARYTPSRPARRPPDTRGPSYCTLPYVPPSYPYGNMQMLAPSTITKGLIRWRSRPPPPRNVATTFRSGSVRIFTSRAVATDRLH
jgi:hypothetical protein